MSPTTDFQRRQTAKYQDHADLTVSASGTVSSSTIVAGFSSFALFVPTMDGSALTFQGNLEPGGTFYAVYKDGAVVTMTGLAAAGSHMETAASAFSSLAGLYGLKIAASTSQTSGSVAFTLGMKS